MSCFDIYVQNYQSGQKWRNGKSNSEKISVLQWKETLFMAGWVHSFSSIKVSFYVIFHPSR